jgi:hypothetical protein
LISVLKTPKTVLEICRESVLGDFRSCQILWALRLLGGIGEAPLDVSLDSALGSFAPQPATAPPASIPVLAVEAAAADDVPPGREPELDPTPIPLSEADATAEVISEPWRLAAERPPDEVPMPTRPALALDLSGEATVMLSRDEVESSLRSADDGLPKFELGEPGTGLEDMKVDMCPAAPQDLESVTPDDAAIEEPAAEAQDPAPVAREEREEREAEEQEAAREVIDLDRTARLSREEIEASLREPVEEPVAAAEPQRGPEPTWSSEPELAAETERGAWEPPSDLDGAIASFNARHVVVFRAMRAEIGAGAANFVRSCRGALDAAFAELFATADLRADGSWDPDGLRRSVVEHRIGNAADGFTTLLEGEMQRLRAHMGEKRAAALAEQLTAIP